MTRIYEADNFIGTLGFEAYRVGGSVRDELLGRKPKDADYIVRGVPMDDLRDALIRKGARVSRIVARDMTHLGWRANVKDIGLLEIVLPRIEKNAGAGRRQNITVNYTLPLATDAHRRDFTFNALYKGVGEGYPEGAIEGGVIDPLGTGLHDLQHRIIRVTHADSFVDDPLRTLRALRFISTLDADLDAETRALMALHAEEVTGLTEKGVSGTVLDEFKKLLMGQAPAKALRIARDTGVLAVAMPELAPMLHFDQGSRYHDLTTCEHVFKALETAAHVDAPLRVRMALLFHDAGKPEAAWIGPDGRKHYYAKDDKQDHEVVSERLWREASARLNVERRLRADVSSLILNHMVPIKTRAPQVRVARMRVQFGDELLADLFLHRCCDLSGKGVKVALDHIERVQRLESTRAALAAAGVPASIKDLEIGGEDAKTMGLEGRAIGEGLARVLDEVVCRPGAQTMSREWQLSRLAAYTNERNK